MDVPPHPPNDMVYGELGRFPYIFRLQLVVCNIGSVYVDSLYTVIPEKHTICYADYKKEIAKQNTLVYHVKCLLCVNGIGYRSMDVWRSW